MKRFRHSTTDGRIWRGQRMRHSTTLPQRASLNRREYSSPSAQVCRCARSTTTSPRRLCCERRRQLPTGPTDLQRRRMVRSLRAPRLHGTEGVTRTPNPALGNLVPNEAKDCVASSIFELLRPLSSLMNFDESDVAERQWRTINVHAGA